MEDFTQESISERVSRRLAAGVDFEFDSFFKNGWNIFKQVFWQVLVGAIIIAIPLVIVSAILGPLLAGPNDYNPYDIQPGDQVDFFEIMRKAQEQNNTPMNFLKQSIITLISVLVSAPLQAGFIKLCRQADKDGPYFGDMFIYYKNEYTGRIIGAGLITAFMSTLTGFLLNYIPVYGALINLSFSMVYYLLFVFVTPLIIFGNAGLLEAFKLSTVIVFRKFFPVLGFILLYWLLAMSGLVLCCIGVILTFAFVPVCNYLLYKYAVGFPEDELDDENNANTNMDGGTPHWLDQPPSAG
jgi:hypothetical protein